MFIVDDILDKLKNILKTDSKTKKVFDKELAEALDLTQANFATMKNRGKIPYTNILNFCAKRKRPEGLGKSILKEILFFFYRICLKDMDPFEDDESNEAPGAAGNGKERNIEKSSF